MLPDWIPKPQWDAWVEMRVTIKKPLKTQHAITLAINTLQKFKDEGMDVGAVLDQSTMNSWQGLFPVRERRAEPRPGQRPVLSQLGKHGQATANNAQDWLEGL
jgi:hypothetical protein